MVAAQTAIKTLVVVARTCGSSGIAAVASHFLCNCCATAQTSGVQHKTCSHSDDNKQRVYQNVDNRTVRVVVAEAVLLAAVQV
jgi:hypothetical protein